MTDKIKKQIFKKIFNEFDYSLKNCLYMEYSAYQVNEMLDFIIEETSKAKDKEFKSFVEELKEKIYNAIDLPYTIKEEVKVFDYCLELIDKLAGEKLK